MLNPTKKKIPHIQGQRRSPSKMVGGGEIKFRIKPHTHQRHLEGSNKTLCAPGHPTETEPDLPLGVLSVSCVGTGQQWPATGTGALGAADLGVA